ncbi:MAG: hypothetical protein ACI88L_000096 [Candidatus Paceibacteria bacterium]|jgi:hypothetical protein
MEHKMKMHNEDPKGIKKFLPLIGMIAVVIVLTLIFNEIFPPEEPAPVMRNFMGSFFLVFGLLKVMKLSDFAKAYREYDLLAMRSGLYAKAYPFIELALAAAFLLNFEILITSWATFVIMLVGAFGVYLKLKKKEEIPCACLGTVFKVPMTWVTLIEDLLMAGMALYIIFI